MLDATRTFISASDAELVSLIDQAHHRLVLVCPAFTDAVARALKGRIDDLRGISRNNGSTPSLQVTVVLDDDPEVYRLGYGTADDSLAYLRDAADDGLLSFQVERGVRIGVLVSDENIVVFSPTPQLIEEETSASQKRPNAIVLSGRESDRLALAAGAEPMPTQKGPGIARSGSPDPPATPPRSHKDSTKPQEIGIDQFSQKKVKAVKDNLKNNPPEKINLARRIRVFSSKVQYVEISVSNYRISTRQVRLPEELFGFTDENLSRQITSQLRVPDVLLEPFEISVETSKGEKKTKVDEKWLNRERRRIENKYTFLVPHYGHLILVNEWDAFEKETQMFQRNLDTYYRKLCKAAETHKKAFENRLVDEFLPRWMQHPPESVKSSLKRFNLDGTEENIKPYLSEIARNLIDKALSFQPPTLRVVRKNVASESVSDPSFIDPLIQSMKKKRVPQSIIDLLFTISDAALARDQMSLW